MADSSALDRFLGGRLSFEGETEDMAGIDPRAMDVRRMLDQGAQMKEVREMQAVQAKQQAEQQRIAIAMQIVGMDVSKAMIGYKAGAGAGDQPDEDFVRLRELAVDVLEATLMPGDKPAEHAA